ncbi:MAG: hypothetical protein HYX53_11485 [Chloroflexi bacterium]|nr:hypothetical protein [Chloroflexota bacterium]
MADPSNHRVRCMICELREASWIIAGEEANGGLCATCRENLWANTTFYGSDLMRWEGVAIAEIPQPQWDAMVAAHEAKLAEYIEDLRRERPE